MPLIWVAASQLVDLLGAHVKWPPSFFCKQRATYMFPKVYSCQIQQKRGIHNAPFCLHPRPRRGCPHGALASFCHEVDADGSRLFSSVHIGKIMQTFGNMRFQASGQIQCNYRSNGLFSCRKDQNNDQRMPVALVNGT